MVEPDALDPFFSCAVIESIANNREPQPEYEAMYLLMPTNQNVDRVIRDFSGNTKQYAAGHLFFVEGELLFLTMILYLSCFFFRSSGTLISTIDVVGSGTSSTGLEGTIHQLLG
jgi:hypothetical protein